MDMINKTDTNRIFTASVLSCYDSPIEVKKPFCINFHSKSSDEMLNVSTRDVSFYGSGHKNSLTSNYFDKSPGSSSNFYISPQNCFTKNYSDLKEMN